MTLNYSNSHSSISGRWIWLWGQQITRTQGARLKPQISLWFRAAVLLPQHSGVWAAATETDLPRNLMGLRVPCTDIRLQTQSSPEVAPKCSSAGMEGKSVQRVSKDSLAAALPAARAGHSLQSSPRVKWVPNALSLLLARGRWRASKGTSFIICCWILRTASNEIIFAKSHRDRKFQQKSCLLFFVQRKQNLLYIMTRSALDTDTFIF